jgi:hypothetical protein
LGPIKEFFGQLRAFFGAPILGEFLLGILTRPPGGAAAVVGLLAGTACAWWVAMTHAAWVWYSPVGCAATLVVGFVAGHMVAASTKPPVIAAAVEQPDAVTTAVEIPVA